MPCNTAEAATLSTSALSVVAARSFRLPRKALAFDVWKAGPLTMTTSWVTSFSEPGKRSPETPMILIASPRGVDTLSGRISPGVVEKRMTTG